MMSWQILDLLRLAGPDFARGIVVTVLLAVLALPLAVLMGGVFAAGKSANSMWLRLPVTAMVEFLRNTPLLLQMFFLYFGAPLAGYRISGEACGIIAIAVQHGAFLADTFLGGVRAVPPSQVEAARAIGMTRKAALVNIVVPQAVLRILAPLGNQLIIAIKDTSVVSGIGVLELTLTGKVVLERTGASFEVFIVIGLVYIALTALVGLAVSFVERWSLPRIG